MPGVMDNDNTNVGMGAPRPPRDSSPELRQGNRVGCWSKLWCGLGGASRKRGIRIAPATTPHPHHHHHHPATTPHHHPAPIAALSPSLLAPPSSPASFANSGNPSTAHSPLPPATPTTSAAATTMFTIGPYAHETTLVTPPAFSAFTTAPSTAPFTPPPELAHFTTPSSPDVPFAQLLTSLQNRTEALNKSAAGPSAAAAKSPYSPSPFASPDYVSRRGEMMMMHQLYPESPLTALISPASGICESEPPSPLPELEFPAAAITAAAKLAGGRFCEAAGSSNHSRELEPIRILSPPREFDEAEEDQQQEEEERCDPGCCSSNSGGCLDLSSCERVLLKVEITCDDEQRVRVNMRPRNGFRNHQQVQVQLQQHHHLHHHRLDSRERKQWSWEDVETMSVDCMELNLADNTIRGDEEEKLVMTSRL